MTGLINIKVKAQEALRVIRGFGARTRDFTPFFDKRIDADTVLFFRRQFASEGREGGTPWAPLKATTIKIKRAAGRSRMGILRFSNELWASLTKRVGPKVIKSVTPREYVRGTGVQSQGVPYPALHQEGFTISKIFGRVLSRTRKVPARPIVPPELPTNLVKRWESLAARFLETGRV